MAWKVCLKCAEGKTVTYNNDARFDKCPHDIQPEFQKTMDKLKKNSHFLTNDGDDTK